MSLRSKLQQSNIYTQTKTIQSDHGVIFRTLAYSPRRVPRDGGDIATNTDYVGHVLLEAFRMSQKLSYCGIILIPTLLSDYREKLIRWMDPDIGFYCKDDPFFSWSYYYSGKGATPHNITDLLLYVKDDQRKSKLFKELTSHFKSEHYFNNSKVIIPIELIHGLVFDV